MLKIAGHRVPNVADVQVGSFDISKADRSASGKMLMDIIATKKRVDVTLHMIKDADLKQVLDAIENNKPFFSLTFPYAGGTRTMTCYSGDILTSLWHTKNGIRYWEEVTLSFIEQ